MTQFLSAVVFCAVTWPGGLPSAPSPPSSEPVIKLPVAPPSPLPNPRPVPGPVTKLGKGVRYVVSCSVKCDVIAFPPDLVGIEEKAGPRDWTAVFAGGTGDYEDRRFDSPFQYAIRAAGVGPVDIVIIPRGYKDQAEWVRTKLDVDAGEGPRPPPEPKPPEPKPPTDDPLPGFPVGQLRVLIVEETASRSTVPAPQLAILFSAKVRDYLDAKCAVEPDGRTRAYRIWDQGVDAKNDLAVWQGGLKRNRTSLPWLVVSNGTKSFEGPLPATVDDALKVLKQLGGE